MVAGIAACGSDKMQGKTTPPTGAQVSAAAKKPADHGALSTTIMQSSADACAADDVGLCGCLPEEAWYTDGTNVYDVICCEEVGNAFNMHACGEDSHCDDSGAMVVCTGAGSGHS
jgi:hypothetical protein